MPELPNPKTRPHPGDKRVHFAPATRFTPAQSGYVDLHTTTNFTFLTGASHPEEIVEQAAALGHRAAAITDRNTLAGIVRAHVAAREIGIPLAVGCRLEMAAEGRFDDAHAQDGRSGLSLSVLAYATNRGSYGRLCRLLSLGKRRAAKGACALSLHDLLDHHADLLAVVVPPRVLDQRFLEIMRGLRRIFDDDRLSLAAACLYGSDDHARLGQLAAIAHLTSVPLVATNDVLYHVPERRPLQDVLTCIRHGCTIATAGFRLFSHAERHMKTPEEMSRLFRDHPAAVDRIGAIVTRATAFTLDELRYQYPREVCPADRTAMEHLRALTAAGARERYPGGIPDQVRTQLEHEFTLIDELAYAPYFLTVHDLVVFARSRGILCQGRGAAANSAVCYCLGVTAVDPGRIDLLFERFVSKERDEPPDIDIDFEHERREEVIQYIYRRYGRDRAALTAEVISYRGRSAVRDVGKALGLSLDCVDRLAKNIDWWHDGVGDPERLRDVGLAPEDPLTQRLLTLSREILGFPRHLSQHVGGFVITETPLCDLVPIENAAMPDRTVIEWDKDDIEAMGMLKVDVLGLGMLTCIRKALAMIGPLGEGDPETPLTGCNGGGAAPALHTVPPEDPAVYDMICAADTVGVFQIESRAQMSMLPRLRPRCFYDLVIEVAIVRPGPIQGDMVHPYLRRRNGEEPVSYPSAAVRSVLEKTLGVPLFQEQAMALAMVAAGFSGGEADQLRQAMAAWKRRGNQIERFGARLVSGMLERGYDRDFAERCFAQIKGFSEYGFPESHAASFALLVYVSAWIKRHHPAAFAAALLNSQPMGFYAPAQIVRDARQHDVEVRPVDVNHSGWDCHLEPIVGSPRPALRLGFRLIKGLREEDATAIADARANIPAFDSVRGLHRTSGVRVAVLRRLASADAFRSLDLERQAALWAVRSLTDEPLPMFDDAPAPPESSRPPRLPPVPEFQKVAHDYAATRLSLRAHPVSFLREELERRGVTRADELADESRWKQGAWVAVAGLVLVRQRPSTAKGIIFMTIEDESAVANLIIRPDIYLRFRHAARHGIALIAYGRVERQGMVVHVNVRRLATIDQQLAQLSARSRDFH